MRGQNKDMARRTKAQILAAKAEEAKLAKAANFKNTELSRRAANGDGRTKTQTDNHQYPTFPHSGPKTHLGQIGRAFEDIDNRIDGVQEGGLNPGSITADKLKTDTPEDLKAFQDALEAATVDDLDAEAAEREEADTQLEAKITAEADARKSADDALDKRVDSEKQYRADGDAKLQKAIDAEAQTREEADAAEVAARTEAVNAVQEALNAEVTARTDADTALDQKIADETEARSAADTKLQEDLEAEATARAEADTNLQSAVDAEKTAREEADAQLTSTVEANKQAADEAIAAETEARTQAIADLTETVTNNKTATDDAIATLTENLATESSERAAADALKADKTYVDDELAKKLNAEANAVSATKLETARNINLTGDVTGTASFDGTADADINVTLVNAGTTGRQLLKTETVADANGILGLLSVLDYKGTVDTETNLPEDAALGDVYNVTDTGMNYAWNGTQWDALGAVTTLKTLGLTATADELNYVDGVTAPIQTQLDAKQTKDDANAFETLVGETYAVKTEVESALALKQDAATAFDGKYTSLTEVPTEFTPKHHTHEIADVNGLQAALDGKVDDADIADMETKTHATETFQPKGDYAVKSEVTDSLNLKADKTAIADMLTKTEAAGAYQPKGDYATTEQITDMETKANAAATYATKTEMTEGLAAKQNAADAFDGKYTSLTEVPSQFTPAAHTHVIADVTDLQDALDAKADASAIPTIPGNATASKAGLMSAEDKTKLDGLNNYILPEATADVLGGVKVGAGLTVQDGKLTTATESKTFSNPEVIGSGETLDLSTATNGVYSVAGGSITGLTGSNETAAALVINAGATHPSALAFDGAFATDKVLPVCQDGTTWFKLTAMDRAEFVPDPAGDTVTKEEFITLRNALVTAGIMKPQA